MRIAILKEKRVVAIIDLHNYILDTITHAHGGDSWMELFDHEMDVDMGNLREGDMVFSDRDESGKTTLTVHPKR